MEQWIRESLCKLLDFPVPDDLIQYVMSIKTEKDLSEYMGTLLDFENVQHKNFFLELVKRKFPRGNSISKQQKKKISKNKTEAKPQDSIPESQTLVPEKETKTNKKTKFVNLYSQEGKNAQVVLLKGRHHCDCQASKHELINNCLQCGRIICNQEGSGPCLFCGNLVCTPEEQREINAKTKGGAKLMESLLDKSRPKGWESAILQRNRLLEYDRTSERRTRVTDDDSDYFNANSVWLTASEREKLQKYQQSLHSKKHGSRLNKKMTFDFAGRQIIEDESIEHEVDEDKIREMTSKGVSPSATFHNDMMSPAASGDRDVAPGIDAQLLQFDAAVMNGDSGGVSKVQQEWAMTSRVQDASLQELWDSGRCLSMHQPWASLLIEGIKLHEGRTWYSNHRGRLWIASTATPPQQDTITMVEDQYRMLFPEKQIKFPPFYPTGCLLGCVNVDDCLPQEEYQKLYPDGESDSPYVFVCSNPISLRLRFPIKGKHKIYQLDKAIHQAALKSIQKMAKIQSDANAG